MRNHNYFVDVYKIQSVPANNLNRDETGDPKTLMFGGTQRIRVSSQAVKKAIRNDFSNNLDIDEMGLRTKNVPTLLIEEIMGRNLDDMDYDKAEALMEDIMKAAKIKINKVDNPDNIDKLRERYQEHDVYETGALFFISRKQISNLIDVALAPDMDDKERMTLIRDAFRKDNAIDVSLFGRMVADDPSQNIDAAAQVAHEFSVTEGNIESDFFTAVDDYSLTDHAGSAMMGNISYDSAVLYGYADISLTQLERNLGSKEAVVKAVEQFVKSFVDAMPTGKQNTFAAHTLPDAVVVTIRDGRPVNYANAFVKVLDAKTGEDVSSKAITRLAEYGEELQSAMDLHPVASFVTYTENDSVSKLGEPSNLTDLVRKTGDAVRGLLGPDETLESAPADDVTIEETAVVETPAEQA